MNGCEKDVIKVCKSDSEEAYYSFKMQSSLQKMQDTCEELMDVVGRVDSKENLYQTAQTVLYHIELVSDEIRSIYDKIYWKLNK